MGTNGDTKKPKSWFLPKDTFANRPHLILMAMLCIWNNEYGKIQSITVHSYLWSTIKRLCILKDWYFQRLYRYFKGILMQIWKSPYMFGFIQKLYLENFALLILINFELFTHEFCGFFHSLLLRYVCKQTFYTSRACISQK